jgi:endo-1,4-beta-D-glucanase Y
MRAKAVVALSGCFTLLGVTIGCSSSSSDGWGGGGTSSTTGGITGIGTGGTTNVGPTGGTTGVGTTGGTTGVGTTGGTTGVGTMGGTTGVGTGGTNVSSGGDAPTVMRANGCAVKPGMIADFEDGMPMPVVIEAEGRSGLVEPYSDKTVADPALTLEPSGGTADCDKVALHVKGSGYTMWGAGVGFGLAGTKEAPMIYNATSRQFTGLKFKAKLGSGHDPKSPVRLNISTPWTESKDNPGGQCTPTTSSANKAPIDCYQHPGKFLPPGSGDGQLGTDWKTFTYCFDRDLYPVSLPSNMTNDQRDTVGANLLKLQFQFNQGKDYSVPYTTTWPDFDKKLPFDFWLDDVTFFTGDCPNMVKSPSNGSPAAPFPQNKAVGSCMPSTNAAKYSAAIADAYATWKKNFVQGGKIVAPEQQNAVTSEALGYGMIISAAMGDKTTFDSFWDYVGKHSSGGLMTWKDGGSGSASDADFDIAYALFMADKQWPGSYKSAGTMVATAAKADLKGTTVTGGSQFSQANYNASYFAPAAFRVFGIPEFMSAISANYQIVNANIMANTPGVPTDWASSSGSPSDAGGAQVTSDITDGTNGAMGYDSARVPWRLGLDKCVGGTDNNGIKAIVDFFAGKYDNGATIDLMKAGWYKKNGMVHVNAKDMQGSFIGPMGVGGMAMGNKAMQDRAVRALLDILESGDYNHTYFPSTVGLFTLLAMTGNFPTP